MKVKNKNPFSLGELDRLFDARLHGDLDYLKEWSKKATKHYEKRVGELYQIIDSKTKMKTYTAEYNCGCWHIFNVEDEHHWKIIDFVICDDHIKDFQSFDTTTRNEK